MRSRIKQQCQPFLIATALLTRIPIPEDWTSDVPSDVDTAKSALYYPLVGLVIGLLLAGLSIATTKVLPAFVLAAIILSIWVLITGALHLDGLADSVDSLFASHGNKERALSVMKDPSAGPMAVVALILAMLLKLSLLHSLATNITGLCIAIVSATFFARLVAVYYILITPYARENGMAARLNIAPYQTWLHLHLLAGGVVLAFVTNPFFLLSVLSCLAIWLFWWRQKWLATINGYTGDCIGGLIEVSEIICLFACVIFINV